MSETLKRFPSPANLSVNTRDPSAVILSFPQTATCDPIPSSVSQPFADSDEASALPLIKQLCKRLDTEGISYCHWKSNWKLSRWLNGDGDLDLLVAIADAKRFASEVLRLGFVQAAQPQNEETPGILHYYGWDRDAAKFVHLHVYHQLLVGHDLTVNYHLPLEDLLLRSVSDVGSIPIPEPESELIVFVLRKILAASTAEIILRRIVGRSDQFEKTAEELAYLEAQTHRPRVYELLKQVDPLLPAIFFEGSLQSLRMDSSLWNRTKVRRQLEKMLHGHARRRPLVDGFLQAERVVVKAFRARLLGRTNRKHLVNGGTLIAIVGGDGAGKTTAVNAIQSWLEENFEVRSFHFGKPRRAPITIAVILGLRTRRLVKSVLRRFLPNRSENNPSKHAGYLQMLRWVCAARDRYRVYSKAHRFTLNGGIAICDRYLVPGINLMDGPNIARDLGETRLNWFSKALLNAEQKHYQRITEPDLLLVLRVDPEIAVRRKTDEQPEHIRTRSEEIWRADWSNAVAQTIDASQSPAAVLADLQDRIWQQLQQPRLS